MANRQVYEDLQRVTKAVESCDRNEPGSTARLAEQLASMQRNLEGPGAYLTKVRFAPILNICQMIAIETGILDAVVALKGETVTLPELAAKVKQDEIFVMRIMRVLCVNGIFTEAGPAAYQSNATSDELITPGQSGAVRGFMNEAFKIGSQIVSQIRTTGIQQFAESPNDKTPWISTFGMPMFEWLKQDSEHKKAFDDYMSGKKRGIQRAWFDIYAAHEMLNEAHDSPTVVDVGGGTGTDMIEFKQRQGDKVGRLVVEDLPETLDRVDKSSLPAGVDLVPFDFFKMEQPIKGASAYLMHQVLHDWSNEKARIILAKTAKAMLKGHSTLLLQEMVLPDAGCSWRNATLDVVMMMFPGGMERTRRQWQELLGEVGLEIAHIWTDSQSPECVIEVRLEGDTKAQKPALLDGDYGDQRNEYFCH